MFHLLANRSVMIWRFFKVLEGTKLKESALDALYKNKHVFVPVSLNITSDYEYLSHDNSLPTSKNVFCFCKAYSTRIIKNPLGTVATCTGGICAYECMVTFKVHSKLHIVDIIHYNSVYVIS